MDKFFSGFGKVVIIILILGAMAYGGYYFGTQTKTLNKPQAESTESSKQEVALASPTSSGVSLVTINGGVSKSSNLSFDQYSVQIPSDWDVKRENQTANDEKLILSKSGNQITIFQAATGGALCLYPGDADFEGPSSKFQTYKEITTQDSRLLRRSGDKNATAYTICQKGQDGSFGQPTNYGHIAIKIFEYNEENLKTVDAIIASLKKI